MPTFTVTDVSQNVRDWDSQMGGPMKEYRVHLQGTDPGAPQILNVEWSRKASSPAPTAGQQVEGTLEDRGQHGMKLKVAPAFGGGQFGSRPEDPKRAARILRQHSQHMSLQAIELGIRHQIIEAPTDGPALFALLKKTSDWFDKDAEEAAR